MLSRSYQRAVVSTTIPNVSHFTDEEHGIRGYHHTKWLPVGLVDRWVIDRKRRRPTDRRRPLETPCETACRARAPEAFSDTRREAVHRPFIVLLEQHCADEARDGRLVGEDPDHIKCAA
jgi:hypothetical protein